MARLSLITIGIAVVFMAVACSHLAAAGHSHPHAGKEHTGIVEDVHLATAGHSHPNAHKEHTGIVEDVHLAVAGHSHPNAHKEHTVIVEDVLPSDDAEDSTRHGRLRNREHLKGRKLQLFPMVDPMQLQNIFDGNNQLGAFDPISAVMPPGLPVPSDSDVLLSGNIARLMQIPDGINRLAEVFQGLAGALGGGVFPASLPVLPSMLENSDEIAALGRPFDAVSAFGMLLPQLNDDVAEAENDPERANNAASQIISSLSAGIRQMIPEATQQVTSAAMQKAMERAMEQAMENVAGTTFVQNIDDQILDQMALGMEIEESE